MRQARRATCLASWKSKDPFCFPLYTSERERERESERARERESERARERERERE